MLKNNENENKYVKIKVKDYQIIQDALEYYKNTIEMIEEITYQGEVYEMIKELKEQLNTGGKNV